MKKLLKSKYFIAGFALLLLCSVAFAAVKVRQNSQKKAEEKEQGEQKEDEGAEGKFNELTEGKATNPQENTGQTSGSSSATSGSSGTSSQPGVLTDVILTVYINYDTGGVSPYFYVPQGTYTAQKLVGTSWQNVATNIKYVGHGGLNVAEAGSSEDNISYRIMRVENGNPVQISKTFLVRRADLTSGVKTYN